MIPKSKVIQFLDAWGIIMAFFVGKLVLHLSTQAYGFHRDEFLYLIQGDHLALGYMVVPPSIAFFGWLTNAILGDHIVAVRFVPALVGGLTIVVTGLLTKELGGRHFAQFLACLAVFSSIAFLRINSLFQPVSFNVFYWVLGAYLVIRYTNSKNPNYVIVFGALCGIALLNKYSVLVFILGIVIGLLMTNDRSLFRTKHPYLAFVIALVIFFPNLIWQWQNGFPLVTHMALLTKYQLTHVSPGGFLKDQILFNANSILIWMAGIYFLAATNAGKKYQMLLWTFLTVIAVLLTMSGKSYYSMGAYPMMMAAGAVIWERWTAARKWFWVRVLIPVLIVGSGLPLLPISLTIYPIPKLVEYCNMLKEDYQFAGPVTWEDATVHDLPQDWADMLGWEELTEIVSKTYHSLSPEEQARTMIFAGNYGEAGSLSYLGRKHGLPEAVSFNASFLYWSPEKLDTDIVIFVDDDTRPTDLFGSVEKVGEITTEYSREKGLPVFLCRQPLSHAPRAYAEERTARLEQGL